MEPKDGIETQGQETTKGSKGNDPLKGCVGGKEESKKVCIPYCFFYFSYEHHNYIPKGSVVAFAENEDGEENEVFEVKEIGGQEEYRHWVPKKKVFANTTEVGPPLLSS